MCWFWFWQISVSLVERWEQQPSTRCLKEACAKHARYGTNVRPLFTWPCLNSSKMQTATATAGSSDFSLLPYHVVRTWWPRYAVWCSLQTRKKHQNKQKYQHRQKQRAACLLQVKTSKQLIRIHISQKLKYVLSSNEFWCFKKYFVSVSTFRNP